MLIGAEAPETSQIAKYGQRVGPGSDRRHVPVIARSVTKWRCPRGLRNRTQRIGYFAFDATCSRRLGDDAVDGTPTSRRSSRKVACAAEEMSLGASRPWGNRRRILDRVRVPFPREWAVFPGRTLVIGRRVGRPVLLVVFLEDRACAGVPRIGPRSAASRCARLDQPSIRGAATRLMLAGVREIDVRPRCRAVNLMLLVEAQTSRSVWRTACADHAGPLHPGLPLRLYWRQGCVYDCLRVRRGMHDFEPGAAGMSSTRETERWCAWNFGLPGRARKGLQHQNRRLISSRYCRPGDQRGLLFRGYGKELDGADDACICPIEQQTRVLSPCLLSRRGSRSEHVELKATIGMTLRPCDVVATRSAPRFGGVAWIGISMISDACDHALEK